MPFLKAPFVRTALIGSVTLGGVVGFLFRLLAQSPWMRQSSASLLMTLGFLLLGPFAVGYITVSAAEQAGPRTVWEWLFLPWPAVLLSAAIAYLLNLEGLICIIFALPLAMVFASIGGLVGGGVAKRETRNFPMVCVALLPLITAPLESRLTPPVESRTVHTQTLIHASAATVWSNVERVKPIAPAELPANWAHSIGFPRPVEATLSYEGIGGVRHASFERGLMFIETVTRWDPNRVLAFSIKADTKNIPLTTLDEHVTIGGRYFDVLQGEYRIEPQQDGNVLLQLSSEERLSTDFNGYAGFWSDAVMRNLQKSILAVIRKRCEATPQANVTAIPSIVHLSRTRKQDPNAGQPQQ